MSVEKVAIELELCGATEPHIAVTYADLACRPQGQVVAGALRCRP